MSDLFGDEAPKQEQKINSADEAAVATEKAIEPTPKAEAIPKPKAPSTKAEDSYTAADIEVLEGLEAVRRRPGMYIGGTDERALHHLFAEVIDNSMDEAVAGHATRIEIHLDEQGYIHVMDNGRGIPIDPHPKQKDKSALEVIMSTLHAGGKFDSKVYETSGGLHGVGISVVNALSDDLIVEVARNQMLYKMTFSKGLVASKLEEMGKVNNRRGTKVSFHPDPEIFGKKAKFKAERIYKMCEAKAYLFAGVEIRWSCDEACLGEKAEIPAKAVFHYPGGLKDYVMMKKAGSTTVIDDIYAGRSGEAGKHGSLEWAIVWFANKDGFSQTYCNTVPTPEGGSHENGLRSALSRSLKAYGERVGNKKASLLTPDDILSMAGVMLSVFIREPEFVGQTKDKLSTVEAGRIVDTALRDSLDHWLAERPQQAGQLLDWAVERAEDRLRRRQEKEVSRKSATRRLRLPGKLADCTKAGSKDSEIFIVEGDSAGGSAKQARDRATQAVLPLRGKILNVANATRDKITANQQLNDLVLALGCGVGKNYDDSALRYEKVIIMTDADVDGAHIASLLMTFFFRQMPDLINNNHLYMAIPPLYKISQGSKSAYAQDDAEKDRMLRDTFTGKGKIEISRFKGLGEMPAKQLKETTMHKQSRTLLRVVIRNGELDLTTDTVTRLMGNKPEARFDFIQNNAEFVETLDL